MQSLSRSALFSPQPKAATIHECKLTTPSRHRKVFDRSHHAIIHSPARIEYRSNVPSTPSPSRRSQTSAASQEARTTDPIATIAHMATYLSFTKAHANIDQLIARSSSIAAGLLNLKAPGV